MKFPWFKGPRERPYDPGYESAPTAGLVTDLAVLDSDQQEGSTKSIFVQTWPDQIILRVQLKPVSLTSENLKIQARFSSNNTVFKPTLLYGQTNMPGTCCKGIDCVYAGDGVVSLGQERRPFKGMELGEYRLDLPLLLYHKAFTIQNVDIEATEEMTQAGHWLIRTKRYPQGIEDRTPVFSYGGFVDPQGDPEKMLQMYALVTGGAHQQTDVVLKSQLFWSDLGLREQGGMGVLGGNLHYYHDHPRDQDAHSLGTALRLGEIQCHLHCDGETLLYRSRDYVRHTDAAFVLDVIFEPPKGV